MAFDFDAAVGAPFRMQPGLRRLAPAALQLTPAAPGLPHMREKLAVLSAFAPQALCSVPGCDAQAAIAATLALAATEHPGTMQWDGEVASALGVEVRAADGALAQRARGRFGTGDEIARCLRALPAPWRLTGLLSLSMAEDFALIDVDSGTIPWLAVALPSRWAPESKVGRHFAEVHAPVADGDTLRRASAALMLMVSGDTRWERFVWTITDWPRLHAHPQRAPHKSWLSFDPLQAWWRSERQTFIPLPERRQAMFTIHVEVTPLAQALAAPGHAAGVHAAIASMTSAVLHYRGLQAVRDPLLEWLARTAAGDAPATSTAE